VDNDANYAGRESLNGARFGDFLRALAVFAAALCASWLYVHGLEFDPRLLAGAAIFGGFLLVGEVLSARVHERLTISASDIGLIAAVALLGPVWALLAALPADLLIGRRSWLRTVYEVSHTVVIIFLSGTVFSFVADPLLVGDPKPSVELLYGTLVAGTTLIAANVTLDGILLKVKYGQAFHRSWQENTQPYLLSNGVDVLTASFGLLALTAHGPLGILVVFAGSLGSQTLVHHSRRQKVRIGEFQERVESLETALVSSNATFGTMMMQELGRKDGYTHRHAAATAVYAADLACEMKLVDACVERLRLAGLLHNIGMFGLPEELLLNAGKLNSVAQYQVAEHPIRGEKMLGAVPEYGEVASWIRWHHERPDGRGYPDKLRGPWIPVEAKILAVAQAYAAMVLDGPRRPGMSPADARQELGKGVDTQFDGVVVRAFLRTLDTESEGYRMADDHRFAFPSLENGGQPKFRWDGGREAVPR
jgi:HD-GYP domain-containing protein (c-di-GMP phosphodiesterase class II)